MGYLGNTPENQAFTPRVDFFSGNASATAFTLSFPVASVAQVQAVIENVPQNPGDAYTVSGNTITFTSAPPSGTNNIYVYYTSPITSVITPGYGTVGLTQLNATGTPSASNYLRGDNSWATIVSSQWVTSGANISYTTGNVGIGTSSPAVLAHVQSTTATTDAVTQVLRLDSQSSGTPANGIGVGIQFSTETAAGNTEIGATIEAITTDVTATSEDFDLSFTTMAAGAAAAERMRVKSTGDFQFNSGYGSVATAYGCRAWVNFNGTGTVAIRASGNVSSITDEGTGDYTVNFTTAMPDAHYSMSGYAVNPASRALIFGDTNTYATGSMRVSIGYTSGFNGDITKIDATYVNMNIFR
jgi:hypothetical protein